MKRALLTATVAGLLILLGIAVRTFTDAPGDTSLLVDDRELMGTEWSIRIVVSPDTPRDLASRASDEAYSELSRIESVMSEWREDTPISRLNREAGSGQVTVPEELADIIRRGIRYGDLTRGSFDISWRGMGALWRFGDSFRPPSRDEVELAIARVDYRRIQVDGDRISIPQGFALGLGGIAKGYAIDRAAQVLRNQGFDDFLVNGGGDVLTSGSKVGVPWAIGIRDPRGSPDTLLGRLRLRGGAVVTSGDYERFQIVDGRRYHHIIDPRTGWPADQCQSVSVLAPTAEQADVLATAVFVLGPEEGLELIRSQQGVEALIVDSAGTPQMTQGLRHLYEPAEPD
jgi:FAD:protein FMN transferase